MNQAGQTYGLRATGEEFPFEASISKTQVNGQFNYTAILRDITLRNLAESDLRIAAAAFESNEGMMVTDAEGVILRVNPAFTETTGYTPDEAIGQTPRILKSGRHDADFYRAMWDTIHTTGTWQGEVWDRRKNGEIFPKWLTISAVKGENGEVTHYVGTHLDITERKAAEESVKSLAYYDPLTELPNRRLLLAILDQALISCKRSGRTGAILFIDLDNFKTLNDTLGHDYGDMLLQRVAQRLTASVREGDTVARLGGDEFVVLLEDLSSDSLEAASQTETIGEKILASLNLPYQLSIHEYHSTPSIGATLFSNQHISVDALFKQADIAMYQSKKAGRNTLSFFDPKMQSSINARVALEKELRLAIVNREFQLYYQIQVDGSINHGPIGAEALIRWIHPERGLIPPDEFIPLAEETGLILPIGEWVLETACLQLVKWSKQLPFEKLTIAVNVSALQFKQANFADQVINVIERTGVNPKSLKLELTESMLVSDIESVIAKMAVLKARGVGFALDDFGTGYSSLSYLTRLPLDQLKIDRAFVMNLETNDDSVSVCAAIISLAHSLKLRVVAEGIETDTQSYILSTGHLCDYLQGYLYGKPLPIELFEALVKHH
jgi:diguanylate cyclase (GGDEF)-like protein/PAS domain S-box-containing protein